ncbi:MAG: 30S ribosomal protein S9 [Oligoflexia bacterium]|nr:30S ribosomal protein S9 [Oligoflexia bacterium]
MKSNAIHTIGRRKSSVARAYVKPGAGVITVNSKPFEVYFGRATLRMVVKQPLALLKQEEKFDVSLNVCGGGPSGQAGACRLAIARALIEVDAANRKSLKVEGYLTRDAREVERKKYGRHGARRRPQFSKR